MKVSMDSFSKTVKQWKEKHPRIAFGMTVLSFYILMMILYFYFMMANLSAAPKFVYTAF